MTYQDLPGHPNIGLTLSGGGARGAAHIGLIRALLEYDIRPSRVVGVSAGAIVGTMYAAGMSPDEMMEFVAEISVFKVIKLGIPLTGLTTMDYLLNRLKMIAPEDRFEALKIPLGVGATNLNGGKFEVFSTGPLHRAVAASCSLPFVFKPVEIDQSLYVDGGVMNNMPTQPLERLSEFIIGSNVVPGNEVGGETLSSVLDITWRVFDLSVRANTFNCRDRCDLLFEPMGVAEHNIFSFKKLQDLHDIGYQYAREKLEALLVNPNHASI